MRSMQWSRGPRPRRRQPTSTSTSTRGRPSALPQGSVCSSACSSGGARAAMAAEPQAGSGGLFESLKALTASLVGIIHTRLELLSLDIAEEREHLITLLLLALAALFCCGVGMVLLALLVVAAFWETHRLLALGGAGGLFLLAGAAMAWVAVRNARNRPRLFATSLAELSKDRQHLGPGS